MNYKHSAVKRAVRNLERGGTTGKFEWNVAAETARIFRRQGDVAGADVIEALLPKAMLGDVGAIAGVAIQLEFRAAFLLEQDTKLRKAFERQDRRRRLNAASRRRDDDRRDDPAQIELAREWHAQHLGSEWK